MQQKNKKKQRKKSIYKIRKRMTKHTNTTEINYRKRMKNNNKEQMKLTKMITKIQHKNNN